MYILEKEMVQDFDFIIYINIGSYSLSRNSFLKDLKVYLRFWLFFSPFVVITSFIFSLILLQQDDSEVSDTCEAFNRHPTYDFSPGEV